MIDLTVHEDRLESVAQVARDKSIRIPTFKMMRDPSLIPDSIFSTPVPIRPMRGPCGPRRRVGDGATTVLEGPSGLAW